MVSARRIPGWKKPANMIKISWRRRFPPSAPISGFNFKHDADLGAHPAIPDFHGRSRFDGVGLHSHGAEHPGLRRHLHGLGAEGYDLSQLHSRRRGHGFRPLHGLFDGQFQGFSFQACPAFDVKLDRISPLTAFNFESRGCRSKIPFSAGIQSGMTMRGLIKKPSTLVVE